MTYSEAYELIKTVASVILKNYTGGTFMCVDESEESERSANAVYPIVNLVPFTWTTDYQRDEKVFSMRVRFSAKDTIGSREGQSLPLLAEADAIVDKFERLLNDTLSGGNVDDEYTAESIGVLSITSHGRIKKEKAGIGTGFFSTFTITTKINCNPTLIREAIEALLLQENGKYIYMEDTTGFIALDL